MTKTEQYQLNQWDAHDPVRREDFNADNGAIDRALTDLKGAIKEHLLFRRTLTAAAKQVDFDFSGIDLTGYRELLIRVTGSYTSTAYGVRLLVNNDSTTGHYTQGDGTYSSRSDSAQLVNGMLTPQAGESTDEFTMKVNPYKRGLLGEVLFFAGTGTGTLVMYQKGFTKTAELTPDKVHTLSFRAAPEDSAAKLNPGTTILIKGVLW